MGKIWRKNFKDKDGRTKHQCTNREIIEEDSRTRVALNLENASSEARSEFAMHEVLGVEIGSWDKTALKLTKWPAWLIFLPLNLPQFLTNSANLAPKFVFFQHVINWVNGISTSIHGIL